MILGIGLMLAAPAAPQAVAESVGWIVDETTDCGTSNAFPNPDERLRWYGECVDGKLYGYGTLVWYRGGRETERSVGSFKNGEFHGEVLTHFPDGQAIVGHYVEGRRHGEFVVVTTDGSHVRAVYDNGQLTSQREMVPEQIALWRQQRLDRLAGPASRSSASATTREPVTARAERRADTALKSAAADRPGQPSPAPVPAPRPKPAPALPQTPVVQPMVPPTPALATALPVASDGAVEVKQLFGTLFAASGRNAVAPAPAEWQVASWTNATGPAGESSETRVSESSSAPPPAISTPAVVTYPFSDFWAPVAPTPAVASYPKPVLRSPPGSSDHVASLPTVYVNPPPRRAETAAGASRTLRETNVASAADTLFAEGYESERAGRFFAAEQTYERILLQYPSAPSAVLANARLNDLRRDTRRRGVHIVDTGTAPPVRSDAVVAVNSPVPAPAQRPVARRGASSPGTGVGSPALNHTVCTRNGLYEGGARWCGIVTQDEVTHYRVEVRDIRLRRFGTIGIARSTCTGNVFLTWLSRGTTVRVPKSCMVVTS